MTFSVRITDAAEEDLIRLLDFLLDRVETLEDLEKAQLTIDSVRATYRHQLSSTPFSFRKAGQSPTRRELIVPAGASGYVVLYEIASPTTVVVLAIRHQLEQDYH
ncbi:type II toxin-antitoxin system RelE/ParE family toxin [Leptothrix discophora]|uniref:Type II toxin-antitoxin system RelE/ParE family toxin n=1 Tax=Leptothrix discophora TaxID=89 RepID=A0ABT9G3G6_LEPDI|nr:type II toxin-antitoxin system RelE/ParE family toxin [Leptothrix discophora]MDP4301025.1 type II toxin-antitoxin system RelE/ParE family toxin [Leptothrix discophora]